MDVSRWKMRLGRLPTGLIGMLVLAFAAESFVARHDLDTLDPDDWQYRLARQTAARNAKDQDVLCFGDSLMKVGVLPKVVESRSGLRMYNLAICGSQAPASYFVLRRALEGGARPAAVLVDFHPALLALKPQVNMAHWPYLLGGLDALGLAWKTHDPSFLGSLLVREALPSVRARNALRGWAVSAASGERHKVREDMPSVFRHWDRHAGAQVMPSHPERDWDVASHQRYIYPAGWKPNRVNIDYLRRFLALAETHGVPVYWLIPPVHPGVQEAKERAGFDVKYLALIRSCQERFPNLVVIDGRHAGYDPKVFFDPDHLGLEGAYALSEDLGNVLRRLRHAVPADRLVALPSFQARTVASGIETFLVEADPATGVPTALR